MDHVDTVRRSEIMRMVRSKDSGPEMSVRRLVHALGYRYRLHVKELPGSPDLVFRSRKKAIFVNGCFWHGHAGCPKARLPKSRIDYWQKKVQANRSRDTRVISELTRMGWQTMVVWQCQLRFASEIENKLVEFLEREPNAQADFN